MSGATKPQSRWSKRALTADYAEGPDSLNLSALSVQSGVKKPGAENSSRRNKDLEWCNPEGFFLSSVHSPDSLAFKKPCARNAPGVPNPHRI